MIVLDTHVWIWWATGDRRLSLNQSEAISLEVDGGTIGVSVVSCWEIAMLVNKQRLHLSVDPLDWMRAELAYPSVELLPLDPEIAVRAYRLPEPFHLDPADRLIVATAIENGCALVTSDRRILDHPSVVTVH